MITLHPDAVNLDKLERELEREIYKQSYYQFYKKAFCQLHPGQEYDENWHAMYLCEVLQKELFRIVRKEKRTHDIIINVPFRSSKSMICTVIFPVWAWTIEPSLKFISVSYSGPLAIEHSSRSLDLINTPWFQRLYSSRFHLKPGQQAKSHYETVETGMRKAVGTGGQITGSGGDIIICLRGDQMIFTDNGYQRIDEIVNNRLNVKVQTFNHDTQRNEFKEIERYDKNIGKRLIKITCGSKTIVCTEDHEVFVIGKGYVFAKDIEIGDRVSCLENEDKK